MKSSNEYKNRASIFIYLFIYFFIAVFRISLPGTDPTVLSPLTVRDELGEFLCGFMHEVVKILNCEN